MYMLKKNLKKKIVLNKYEQEKLYWLSAEFA